MTSPNEGVVRMDSVAENGGLICSVDGRDVVLARCGDDVFAFGNRCPHQGASMLTGRIGAAVLPGAEPGEMLLDEDRMVVRCPWHGWEFDVRTGKSLHDPNRKRIVSYRTEILEGEIHVKSRRAGP